jgi:hypothetical protein
MGKLLGGGALVALAAFMLLGFFSLAQPLSFPVAALTLLVAVGVPGGAGAALLRAHFRERTRVTGHRERLRLETHQAELVRLAARRGGFTVSKVARWRSIPHRRGGTGRADGAGVADIEVTDSGLLVYTFPDVRHLPEKGSSRDILDA